MSAVRKEEFDGEWLHEAVRVPWSVIKDKQHDRERAEEAVIMRRMVKYVVKSILSTVLTVVLYVVVLSLVAVGMWMAGDAMLR